MKLTVAVVLLVLGLASVRSIEVEESISDDLFDYDDLDIEIDDDLSIDVVSARWGLLRKIYYAIEAMERGEDGIQKRFISDTFKKLKDKIVKTAKKVGNFFKNKYSKAKDAFTAAKSKLNFDSVVKKLLPFVKKGMSVTACKTACITAASTVLGPAAPLAPVVCVPVCNGVLSRLEDVTG